MRLLYILNGLGFSRGMPIGGADKRALEIGRYFKEQYGEVVTFLTTPSGEQVLRGNGWEGDIRLTKQPNWWPDGWFKTLPGRVFSYIFLTFFSNHIKADQYDFIYPTSDFFFDLIPAIRFKRSSGIKLVGIVHHLIPLPWKRPGNIIVNFGLFVCQRISFFLLSKFADLIFVAETGEGREISNLLHRVYKISPDKIKSFFNGVAYKDIERVIPPARTFEACVVGGLRASKGVFDLPEIWSKVVAQFNSARLLVIGGGTEENEQKLRQQIKQAGLEKHIELAGVVPQSELYSRIKSAKIFISPSHEEGWGIVLCEAMACGLPVVCYDLPAFELFKEGLLKVSLGDTYSFSLEIIRLLQDSFVRSELAKGARQEAQKFGWDKAADREWDFLNQLI